jgi:hypothetical protein
MSKMNDFVQRKYADAIVASVVNNLINMSDRDLQEVAVLLANYPNGEKLASQIGFALIDKDVVSKEMEVV